MSDNPELPPMVQLQMSILIGRLADEETMAQMDRSCQLALAKQLNKNNSDPRLKALETEWKTMDRFSKREIGPGDTGKK